MGWDFYMRGYGPKTVPEFRAEIAKMITGTALADSTTPTAMYFAVRQPATAHDATIWAVNEGQDYTTILILPYKRPSGEHGFGKGNAYDETGGPQEAAPARKLFDLLTPLRPLNDAEMAYKAEYEATRRMPYPTPPNVRDGLVWAHMWRDRVKAGYDAQAVIKAIKPGVTFRTAGKLAFGSFEADTFTTVEGRGRRKLAFIPENAPHTRCALNKVHLVGATILT